MMNSAVRLLDEAARKYGSRVALEEEGRSLTYAQYREAALSVAAGLPQEARPVLVCLPKSIAALTCFMGAMYNGCPYVPVDSRMPLSRLEKIIASLEPCYIITDESLLSGVSGIAPASCPTFLYSELAQNQPDEGRAQRALSQVIDLDPIYIMFTSGSTGAPKGVVIPHRGILDYACWVAETFSLTDQDVLANQAPFYFDNSTFDIYGCLRSGAKLVLTPESLFLFPLKLPAFLAEKEISVLFWVPTVMINVANSGALKGCGLPYLRLAAFCGEVMPNRQLNMWRQALPACVYANLYGPTEITDVCSYYVADREFADHEPLPIGRACANTRLTIRDEAGRQVPPGAEGELWVGGSGVALGYWRAPDLSERAFVREQDSPYEQRWYRTGDVVRQNERGEIIFIGRRDNQIKLKGNRIELGEIEKAAMCVGGVENACALLDQEREEIVLFIESGDQPQLRPFNQELKKYLPHYMLPSRLVALDKLPHTANDKIDRVELRRRIENGLSSLALRP